jgi:hypothetical protein
MAHFSLNKTFDFSIKNIIPIIIYIYIIKIDKLTYEYAENNYIKNLPSILIDYFRTIEKCQIKKLKIFSKMDGIKFLGKKRI